MTETAVARRPQRLTLDVFGMYVREPGAAVWAGGLVELLGQLDFSIGSARVAVQRLVARGLLGRRRQGRRTRLHVAPRGQALLLDGDDRLSGFGRQEVARDRWTTVWHQLAPSRHAERQELSTRLRFRGFGSVRDGVWIAPGDRSTAVAGALRELRLEREVAVLVGWRAAGFDPGSIWDEAGLVDAYRAFLAELPTEDQADRLVGGAAFRARAELMQAYQRFTRLDPELPDAQSISEMRTLAVAAFDDRYRRLARPAGRYVRAVLFGDGTSLEEGER